MQRHLHALRQKPEHIKKRIAVGSAVGITGLVALVWIVTLASTGAFALAPLGSIGAYADDGSGSANSSDVASADNAPQSNFSKLLGAVGASSLTGGASSSAPALTIVNESASSTFTDGSGQDTQDSQSTATGTPTTLSF